MWVMYVPLGPNFFGGNLLNISGSEIPADALSDNFDKSLRLSDASTSTVVTLPVVPDFIPVITSAVCKQYSYICYVCRYIRTYEWYCVHVPT